MLKSKKRSHDVPSQMCWIVRKDLMTYHPRCVEFQEKILWRTIPDVLKSKKRSHDVPPQMCSSPKNLITPPHPPTPPPHPTISWRTIADVFKSKERYHTPPPPHPPQPLQPTPRKKKQQKTAKKEVSLRRNAQKMGLSLWRRCSEVAKTLFREAAFCARPA